jgi:cell division protein FtsL
MVTRSSTLRHDTAERVGRNRVDEARRPSRARPPLGVVDRRGAVERGRRRQARVLFFVSGAILAIALTVAAAGHALLASTQVNADTLQGELAQAVATQQNLQLERAQLETPSRVLAFAEHRLRMVAPSGVTYLQPVDPGETVLQAHESPGTTSQQSGHHTRSR